MKRSCESSLPQDSVDKKTRFTVNLSNITNVSLENIHLAETIDLTPECAAEIVHPQIDHDQITQEEDSLVAETSFGVLVEFMDITEPLNKLRTLLEHRTGICLSDYKFYLQDTQELDPTKNLVNQCVQGEGLVQINVDVTDKEGVKKINIIDVLKPLEEVPLSPINTSQGDTFIETLPPQKIKIANNSQHVTRWFVSPEFRKIQDKYGIPQDPLLWSSEHVRHWFDWASSHFNLPEILGELDMTGVDLMTVSPAHFMRKVPIDPGDLFWTHLELLKKFKIVSVLDQSPSVQSSQTNSEIPIKNIQKSRTKNTRIGSPRIAHEGSPGYSGQIQLWQFLLELLTDKDHRSFIQWVGNDGEFKLINPEMVAQLWGQRKNKPTMNYEKLSRALRYYYDGEMIAKVHGKRFVYKFVYDLKSLLGYDAAQLNRLVSECALKHQSIVSQPRIVTFSSVDSNSSSI